jgi:hypothetical protein
MNPWSPGGGWCSQVACCIRRMALVTSLRVEVVEVAEVEASSSASDSSEDTCTPILGSHSLEVSSGRLVTGSWLVGRGLVGCGLVSWWVSHEGRRNGLDRPLP